MARIPDITALGQQPVPGGLLPRMDVSMPRPSSAGSEAMLEIAKMAEEQQKQNDIDEYQSIRNAANEWEQANLWDVEKGAANLQHEAAFGVSDRLQKDFGSFRKSLTSGIKSRRARQYAEELLDSRAQQIGEWSAKHERSQRVAYGDVLHAASVDSSIQRASNWAFSINPANPDDIGMLRVEAELAAQRNMEAEHMRRKGITDPGVINAAIMQREQGTHSSVLSAMLENGHYAQADSYFNKYKDRMDPVQRNKLHGDIMQGVDFVKITGDISSLMNKSGPMAPPSLVTGFVGAPSEGIIEPGNINLYDRPQVPVEGGVATVRSMSFKETKDGPEILVPTVSDDGRIMTNDEAIRQYKETGRHLGKFENEKQATAYAKALSAQQGSLSRVDDGPIDVKRVIVEEASAAGVDPNNALVISMLESGLNPTAKNPNGSATGLFQFIDSTWKQYGGNATNRMDPRAQAKLGMEYIKDVQDAAGEGASAGELYFTYVVGPGGGKALKLDRKTHIRHALIAAGYSNKQAAAAQKANGWVGKTLGDVIDGFDARWRGAADRLGGGSNMFAAADQATMTDVPVDSGIQLTPPPAVPSFRELEREVFAKYGSDPRRYKMAHDELVRQYNVSMKEREQADKDGLLYGYTLVENNGGRFELLTQEQRQKIGVQNLDAVRSRAKNVLGSEEPAMNWDLYIQASNIDRLSNATEKDMQILSKQLPAARFLEIHNKWEKIKESDDALGDAKIDQKDFDAIALRSGLDPSTKDKDEKIGILNLQYEVDRRITAHKRQTGKEPDREGKRVIMQQVIDDKVLHDGGWFGSEKELPVTALTEPMEKEAYVRVGNEEIRLAEIPDDKRAEIVGALQKAGRPVTQQSIARFWKAWVDNGGE